LRNAGCALRVCFAAAFGMPQPRLGQFGHDAAYAKGCSDWSHDCRQHDNAPKKTVPASRRRSLAALVTEATCRAAARKTALRPSTAEPELSMHEPRFAQVQSKDRRSLRNAPPVIGAGSGNRIWGMENVEGMVAHMRCVGCKRFGKLRVSGADEKITGLRSLVRLWCKHCQHQGGFANDWLVLAPLPRACG
jgi:hypothetical protein